MLKEWLRSLRTPTSPYARQLGYLYESIALEERAERCQNSWKSHIEHCHGLLRQAISKVPVRRQVLILGSGPLIEIPMADLLHHFQQVVLVDIVQPLAVRRRHGSNGRVLLIEKDLNSFGVDLQKLRSGAPLPEASFPDFSYLNPDLTVSANLLSQLPHLPRSYVEERFPGCYSDVQLNTFSRRICQAHLDGLLSLPGHKLLWSDLETKVLRDDGVLLEHEASLFDWGAWALTDSWTWTLAPHGEIDKRRRVEMSMGAVFFEAAKDFSQQSGKI